MEDPEMLKAEAIFLENVKKQEELATIICCSLA
jgi:hypothetical protein